MTETNATVTPPGGWPPGRYGRRRERRRHPRWLAVVMVVGVLLAGGVAAVVLGQQYGTGRAYDATVLRFYDLTDEQVVVEFAVVVPAGEVAVCAVRARDNDGVEVGRAEVRVEPPPPGQRRAVVTHTLPTTGRPITGEVQRCWPER